MRTVIRFRHYPFLLVLAFGLLALGCDTSGITDKTSSQASESESITSQSKSNAGPGAGQGSGRQADVRVGHLSPDAPGVDVYVGKSPDGNPTIGGLTYPNLAPNASGEYLSLSSGSYDISVTPAGSATPEVIDVDGLDLDPNRDYTILAIGELSPEGNEPGIQALPLVDNAEGTPPLPARDKTLVRFVHAAPDAGAVDIAVDGATLLSDVTFGTASGYVEAEPGERTIEVKKGGSTVLTVSPTLIAGTKITAYVIGNATPEAGDQPLSATTSIDAVSPAGSGPVGAQR